MLPPCPSCVVSSDNKPVVCECHHLRVLLGEFFNLPNMASRLSSEDMYFCNRNGRDEGITKMLHVSSLRDGSGVGWGGGGGLVPPVFT